MAKMTKAQCSTAGKELSTLKLNGTKTREVRLSAAGKKLAQCRWHKPKKKAAPKKPKAAKAGVRQSRRLAGKGPVRGPEPPKKPRKPAKKKKVGGQSSEGLKKVENILVPGLNAPKGDMKNYLAAQRRLYGV